MKSMACVRREVRLEVITVLLALLSSVFMHCCFQNSCVSAEGYCGQLSHIYDVFWNIHSQCWVPGEKDNEDLTNIILRVSCTQCGEERQLLEGESTSGCSPIGKSCCQASYPANDLTADIPSWKPFSPKRNIMAQRTNSAELRLRWTLPSVFSKYHCCHGGKGLVERNMKKNIIGLRFSVVLPMLLCDLLFWASTGG